MLHTVLVVKTKHFVISQKKKRRKY